VNLIRSDLLALSAYSSDHYEGITDKLDANEVAYDLPLELKQKLAEELTNQLLSNRYPDGIYASLRGAISRYVGVAEDQITIGNGSDELIRSVLIVSSLGRGDILVATPTFSMYKILAQSLGITVHSVDRREEDFTIDLDEAQKTIEREQIKTVFVVHPNSPTGNLLTDQEISWLKSLPDDILVVIDEAYYEFAGHSLVAELPHHANWLILRTFSKAWRLAAFRLGYAVASPDLISALEKVRLPYNLPTMTAIAGELVLQYKSEILSIIPSICQARQTLWEGLTALSQLQVWRSAGNFIYFRSPDDRSLHHYLATQGTLIRRTGGGLRVTIGTPDQNQRTIDRVQQFFQNCP